MSIEYLLKSISNFEYNCSNLDKFAKIKKLPNGKYRVVSEKGKNLGTSDTREGAVKRLREVEFFKHDSNHIEEKIIDLTKATDFSYSAIMREIRQEASKDQVREFIILFKKEFDKAIKSKLQKPEKVALQNSLIKFNKKHKIKCKKKLVKNAAIAELGDPILVGKYLADIVKFTINKIPLEKRFNAIQGLKQKFNAINVDAIAQKKMPPTSAIGQSITLVKHVLYNHNSNYVRQVINSLVSNL